MFSNKDLYRGNTNRSVEISENVTLGRNEQACLLFFESNILMKNKGLITWRISARLLKQIL